jgi:hypothetical protein
VRPKVPSPTWRSFLQNQLTDTVAIDMFVVATATFRLLYALIVLGQGRRRVMHFSVTQNPTQAWLSSMTFPRAELELGDGFAITGWSAAFPVPLPPFCDGNIIPKASFLTTRGKEASEHCTPAFSAVSIFDHKRGRYGPTPPRSGRRLLCGTASPRSSSARAPTRPTTLPDRR